MGIDIIGRALSSPLAITWKSHHRHYILYHPPIRCAGEPVSPSASASPLRAYLKSPNSDSETTMELQVILVVFVVQLLLSLISSIGAQAVNDLVRTRRIYILAMRQN